MWVKINSILSIINLPIKSNMNLIRYKPLYAKSLSWWKGTV